MSEITRKKFEKKVTLKHGTLTIKGRPWTTPSELGKETEFLRQAEDARRNEQQIKQKLSEVTKEQKSILRQIINVMDAKRGDEARDASDYFNLSKRFYDIPTAAKLFRELSEAEDLHQKKLRTIADELERQIKNLP